MSLLNGAGEGFDCHPYTHALKSTAPARPLPVCTSTAGCTFPYRPPLEPQIQVVQDKTHFHCHAHSPPPRKKKKKTLFLIYLSLNYNQKTSHLTQGSSAISCPSFRHPYPIKLTSLTPCLLNPYMSLHSPQLLFHSRSPLFLAWNYLNLSTCFPAY